MQSVFNSENVSSYNTENVFWSDKKLSFWLDVFQRFHTVDFHTTFAESPFMVEHFH